MVGADIGPISAFEIKRIDAKGILLLSEDATSEVLSGGRTVIGKAVQFSYLTGGAEGSNRWEMTEEASFYACPSLEWRHCPSLDLGGEPALRRVA